MSGTKDPYDEAFEDGAANWNLLVANARRQTDPLWDGLTARPEAARACVVYAHQRYLGLLPTEELFDRYRTLLVATMRMDETGYLEPAGWNEWSDKWIHSGMELALRSLSLTDERATPDWSFVRTPRILRAVAASSKRRLNWGSKLLVKYGSPRFLRPALENGTIRISPASSYDDPTLNTARRDEELERVLTDYAFELTATLGPMGDEFSAQDRSLYTSTVRSGADYYIFCLAAGFQLRLFDDFEADACLVITDPARFVRALGEAFSQQLPGWNYGSAFVRYIDPFQRLSGPEAINAREEFAPFFCKLFRYWYQKEVRAAWLPPHPGQSDKTLEHIFVELGNLEDYCELIEL